MTTAVVVMIGAGILLIISAIEDSPLVATFQAVWQGKPLSSLANSGASGTSPGPNASGTPAKPGTSAPKPRTVIPGGNLPGSANPFPGLLPQ